ncbi:MAG: DnaA/Hda family protein, partial [Rhodospirillaceae bacterium]
MGRRTGGRGEAGAESGGTLEQQWQRVRARLRDEVGETAFRSWLKPLALGGLTGGDITILVPTRFMRDWVLTHYADRIRGFWAAENPQVQAIDLSVQATALTGGSAAPAPANGGHDDRNDRAAAVAETLPEPVPAQVRAAVPAVQDDGFGDVSAPLDPRFTFDNFVVGKPNELAHAAARRVAEASAVTFNPLFLYGGVGLGKTHLMHAIAHLIKQRQPQRKVIYLSAEKFMYQFIRALRFKDTMA